MLRIVQLNLLVIPSISLGGVATAANYYNSVSLHTINGSCFCLCAWYYSLNVSL